MGSYSATGNFLIMIQSIEAQGQSPFQIVYGMQPRGVSELKYSEQDEFRSASAERLCRSNEGASQSESRSDCRVQIKNTSTEQINTGENFNLKLVI
jgi:hypothetical protein